MTAYQWIQVLAFAGGVIERAVRIVLALREEGCTVEGCPSHVEADLLARAREPIPAEDERMGRAANEARRRVAGLDAASVRSRLDRTGADEVLRTRPGQSAFGDRRPGYAAPESPAAAEVYPDPRDDDGA